MKTLTALGVALLGLTAIGLLYLVPWDQAEGVRSLRFVLTWLMAASIGVYFLAVRTVLRHAQPRHAVWFVLAVAMAMRLPMVFAPAILSSDVYRYVWDGQVQAAGINPYLYIPADPALDPVRDEKIFPHINRADYAHTIYPPAAQVVFAAIASISPTVLAEKLAIAGFEALAIFFAIRLLALAGLPAERVLIYAWNPNAVWSFGMDGHVDAIGIALIAGALLLRCRGRDGWAGAVFGAAVLVKFLPLAIGPALWRRGGGWRLVAAGSLTIAALYACYAGAGWKVLGFLPGYGAEEGFTNGSGVWLLAGLQTIVPLPAFAGTIYGVVAILALGALALWIMTRPDTQDVRIICARAALLAACATAAIGPHYPWYFAWIALPAVVAPNRAALWLAAAAALLILDPIAGWFIWPSLIYVPAILLALAELRPTLSPIEGIPRCPQRL